MQRLPGAFYESPAAEITSLGDRIAEVTAAFCWGPNEGWDLTPRQVDWWYKQSLRIEKARRGI